MKPWWVAGKCSLVAVLAVILYLTNDPFFMVGGSDSTSLMIGPPVSMQFASIVVVAAALMSPATPVHRARLAVLAICVAALGGHRLVIDDRNHQIRDVYLAIPVQTLAIDPAREGGFEIARTGFGFQIGQAGAIDRLWCVSPPVLGLDLSGLRGVTHTS